MAEQWKIEYDRRQYALMKDQLRRYEQGKLHLDALIIGLESLLGCLEAADEHWKDEFLSKIGMLEDVNAEAHYQVEKGVSPDLQTVINEQDNQRLIRVGIEHLRRLLECASE